MASKATKLLALDATALAQRMRRIRGEHVLLDTDLATLFAVDIQTLRRAVRRYPERFPQDFAFRLTPKEIQPLRSQSVILNTHSLAFTELGVAMLASVLKSARAVQMSLEIVRRVVGSAAHQPSKQPKAMGAAL